MGDNKHATRLLSSVWLRVQESPNFMYLATIERQGHKIKGRVQNLDLESVTLSAGPPLCPYGVALFRAHG